MKKIIAISVMFALIAGAVFADTSVGGGMSMGFNLASSAPSDTLAGNFHGGGDIQFSWEGENAGGQYRIYSGGPIKWSNHVLGWWKPIDQLKIHLGNWDTQWGHSQIIGWGFTAGAKGLVADDWNAYYGTNLAGDSGIGFWGGFGNGLGISIYPADGFEINIGIPLPLPGDKFLGIVDDKVGTTTIAGTDAVVEGDPVSDSASVIYMNTDINVKADIPNIGTVKLALDLQKANKNADIGADIYFAFYLSAIENMGAELGVAVKNKGKTIDLGVGYSVNADDFGLKVGLGVGIIGNKVGDKELLPISLQLLPSYNLGSLTAFFNVGMGTNIGASTSVVNIWVNPYVQVPISGGNFFAGIKLQTSTGTGSTAKWAIPVGFGFDF